MRLKLKKRLAPYESLSSLAEDLGITLPKLQRIVRHLERQGRLDPKSLCSEVDHDPNTLAGESEDDEILFESFFEAGQCLVCGGELIPLSAHRSAGWGEFSQCRQCGFSAHQKASFEQLRDAAWEQLQELRREALRAQRIFARRTDASRGLD